MAHSVEDVQKHVKKYFSVFFALIVLTVITVGVSYLHLSVTWAIVVALVVASIKGTLVAGIFMHLFDEKKVIYWSLILTIVFFIALMTLPIFMDVEIYHYLNRMVS